MADSETGDPSPQRFQRGASAAERLSDVSFPLAVRGYDRRAVDEFLEQLQDLVAALESRQTRESVVQKALNEVGEETAGILQRAHETADEIASRSRAKADGRLQRAEREAEIVRRDADEYARHVVDDTRVLWEERLRLIEDIRQLADEVLATADDAMERVKMPELLSRPGPGGAAPSGPVGLAPGEANGPRAFEVAGAHDDIEASQSSVEGDPGAGEVEAYRLEAVDDDPTTGEVEAYPLSAVEDALYDDPTTGESEAYPLEADEDTTSGEVEAYTFEDDTTGGESVPPEGAGDEEEDRDHTVELEALPGGEEPPEPEPEQRD